MSDLVTNLANQLGETWNDVVLPAFRDENTAARWLMTAQDCLGGSFPLVKLNGSPDEVAQVTAILERFDGETLNP